MKTTVDTYTGKSFAYDPELLVAIGGVNTVARYRRGYLEPLHPDRLTKAMFDKLNPEVTA